MRISKTRLAVRVLLIAAIFVTGGIGFRYWQIHQPSYHWQRAQAALAAGHLAAAELELRSCLARLPNHGWAHFRLAEVLFARAQRENATAEYVPVPAALSHLKRSAQLLPQQLEIQRTLLRVLIAGGSLNEAEATAAAVERLDAHDPEAAVSLARQALRRRDFDSAAAKLKSLSSPPPSLAYYRWWLEAELGRAKNDPRRRFEAATSAIQYAAAAAGRLPTSFVERQALSDLLLLGIEAAPDAAAAQAHVAAALSIVAHGPLAPVAGQLGQYLERRFPLSSLPPDARAEHQRLTRHIAEICQQQIASPNGGPLSAYSYLAEQAAAAGDNAQALALLKRGLASPTARSAAPRDTASLHLLAGSLLLATGRYEDVSQHVKPLLADESTAAEARMLAGSLALAQSRYEDARREFEAAASRLGTTLPVRLALATTYLALQQPADALPHLQEVVARLDELNPAEKAWLARYVGDGLALRRALVESLLAVDRAEEANPHLARLRGTAEEPSAQIALAGWHWRHHRQAQADAVLSAAREERPDDISLVLAHAAVISQRGTPEDGDALLSAFAALRPDDLPRQLALLQWRVWRGQTDAALAMLPELKQRFGALPLLGSIEAQLLLAADKTQDALAAADKLRAAPQTKNVGSLLAAAAALKLGHAKDAAAMLAGAGAGPLVDLSRAKLLAATGQDAAALDILVSALRYRGTAPQAEVEIGATLDSLAQRQGVRAALAKAGQLLAQRPDEPALLAAHANLALAAGEPDTALADLEKLDKAIPGATLVPYLRAQARFAKGELDAAAAELAAILAKNPKHLDARVFAAEVARSQGKLPQALQQAEWALAIDPTRQDAALLAADALLRLNRNNDAIEVLKRSIQAAPDRSRGYIELARCYEVLKRPQDALQTLTAAQQRLPRDWDLLAAHASTLSRHNQAAAAVELVARRAAQNPDAFEPEQLGWLMLRLGQFAAARQWGDEFLATNPTHAAEAHWLLGNIALLDGSRQHDLLKLDEAKTHFRHVLEKYPQHLGATNNLAWILANDLGQPQEALALMRRMLDRPELKNVPPESLPPTVIDTLAVVLTKAGQEVEARQLLARAVRNHPQAASLHYQFGLAQLSARNYAEAETALQTALRLGLTGDEAQHARAELTAIQHGRAG